MMKYCTECGSKLVDMARFCSHCGKKVTDVHTQAGTIFDPDRIYRLTEASDITGLSRSSLRRRIESGTIKRVSGRNEDIRILGSELLKLLTNK